LSLQNAELLMAGMLLAIALDWHWGEPPASCHPVVAMGRYFAWAAKWVAPLQNESSKGTADWRSFCCGAAAWCAGAFVVLGLALAVQWVLVQHLSVWGWPLLAVALKPLFAWRMLHDEVQAVDSALQVSLTAGQGQLSRLVSRDVQNLDVALVQEGAIETLAENLNDSVVAPMFYFLLGGLPLAALYRFANTADAMWGYSGERHGRQWQWAGKWAARADDVLSYLPARLSAAALLLAHHFAFFASHRTKASQGLSVAKSRFFIWSQLPENARLTPSPNGGWPMSAVALCLGVRLRKPGVYTLNEQGRCVEQGDVANALQLCRSALWILLGIAWLTLLTLLFFSFPWATGWSLHA
jgi:adenosylcobinamide-phosphate synthase